MKNFVFVIAFNILLGQFLYAGGGSSKCESPFSDVNLLKKLSNEGIYGGRQVSKDELQSLTHMLSKNMPMYSDAAELYQCTEGPCSYLAEEAAMYFKNGKSIFANEREYHRMLAKMSERMHLKLRNTGSMSMSFKLMSENLAESFDNVKGIMFTSNSEFVENVMSTFRSDEYSQGIMNFIIYKGDDSIIQHAVNIIPIKVHGTIYPMVYDSALNATEIFGEDLPESSISALYGNNTTVSKFSEVTLSRGHVFKNIDIRLEVQVFRLIRLYI